MKPGRNDPCPCGSGKKYKKCCEGKSGINSPAPVSTRKAVAPTPSESSQLVGLFNGGRFAEVEIQARLLIGQYPASGFLWQMLGLSLKLQGKDGRSALQKATELLPGDAGAHYNLGIALNDFRQFEDAVASYRLALKINPEYAEAHGNLGIALKDLGQLDEAVASYRRALKINPYLADAHNNLGTALKDLGQLGEAVASQRRALEIAPNFFEAHYNLGNTLKDLGQLDEAVASYRRALAIKPDYAEAHYNLGIVLNELGQIDEAVDSYRRALEINPDYVEAHNNLGDALKDLMQLDEAVASLRRALALKPAYAEAHNNLGNALTILGQIDEAVASYRRALAIKPDNAVAHSNVLLTMQYTEKYSPAEIYTEHLAYAARFEQPLKVQWQPHENSIEPRRQLKIGYVSPDFRQHSVAYFIEPVLAHHNKNEVEVSCYYNFPRHDAVTERIKGHADRWLDCSQLGDDELAQRIRDDGIDILVDLAGHTAHNRLLTFARKPAPLQVTWLGYPATTGLAAMDYRLTDHHAEPVGMTERLNTETLCRLPGIFCYHRGHEISPPVIDHPPGADKGCITFGSFNNYAKISDAVLKLWAQILVRLPSARLLLKIKGIDRPLFRAETEVRLQRLGFPLERVILEPWGESPFSLYNEIDIALDPFPYNGTTTSMDTLWMGVPFISLAGISCVSRMGVTILTNAGLPELIADTPEAYVNLAIRLALEPEWLHELRDQLRQKASLSPLMDEAGFTHQLEAAYREMWRDYCAKQG